MAVESEITEKRYNPGGTSQPEALFGIVFHDPAELIVERWRLGRFENALVRDLDYVIGGNGAAGSGWITALSPWPADVEFYIRREGPAIQGLSLSAHKPLPSADVERAFDKVALRLQEQRREGLRAIQVPRGEASLTVPSEDSRKGRILGFGEDGSLIAVDTISATDVLDDGLWNPLDSIIDDGGWG